MNVSRENKKKEAIKRMKALGIIPEAIRQFEEEDLVNCSEPPFGANYWLNNEQKEIVKKFEEEYNALVYFAIRSHAEFGELISYLYVSDYEEEWQFDNEDIKDGYVYAYVYNVNIPDFSELGSVGVKPMFGGLIRTA